MGAGRSRYRVSGAQCETPPRSVPTEGKGGWCDYQSGSLAAKKSENSALRPKRLVLHSLGRCTECCSTQERKNIDACSRHHRVNPLPIQYIPRLAPEYYNIQCTARGYAAQGALAEELSFHSFWLPENHFGNHTTLPSPLLVLNAVASRTERPRLGTGSYLPPSVTHYRPRREWRFGIACLKGE